MGSKILSTTTEPAVLFFFLALACLSTCIYITHKNFKAAIDSNDRIAGLLARCMDHLKAQSLEERVQANALEKENDVRIQMLKDAIKREAEEGPPKPEHVVVTTTDGRRIDMADYEIM
tara:strand:- start:100 stop:453 length:354 start_codon:yes stop_codon:yes gene_type:complete